MSLRSLESGVTPESGVWSLESLSGVWSQSLRRGIHAASTSSTEKIKLASFEDDKTPPPLLRETMVEIEKPLSPPPSSSVIAEIFPPIDPPAVPKSSRTREWLLDYSDCDDDDDASDDESIDILDLPPPGNVRFLPTTMEGLRASLEKLVKNITEDRKSGGHEKPGIETKPCSSWMN